jgi:hypothetical protein
MGYQEENYNSWDFSIAIFDIKYRIIGLRTTYTKTKPLEVPNTGTNFIQSRYFMSKIAMEKSQEL